MSFCCYADHDLTEEEEQLLGYVLIGGFCQCNIFWILCMMVYIHHSLSISASELNTFNGELAALLGIGWGILGVVVPILVP